jgi:hypothetical protein
VSNIVTNSVSAIFTPPISYADSFISLIQQPIKYEQGFIFNEVEAFNKSVDVTVNNGAFQFLTSKKLYSDFTRFNINSNKKRTLTTPLIFNAGNLNRGFLTVIYDSSVQPNRLEYTISSQSFDTFINNIFFELEFLDDIFLRVKHNDGKKDYFLTLIGNNLEFAEGSSTVVAITAERPDMFRYSIDEIGYLQLYKNTPLGIAILSLSGTQLVVQQLTPQTKKKDSSTLIRISYSYEDVEYNPNSSWISYDTFKYNALKISNEQSAFNYTSQFLLHTPISLINDNVPINILSLQNNFSEKGFVKRGTNMIGGDLSVPKTSFREYTNLFTGNDQEGGNDNISLTYAFFDKDIKIENGADTFFKAPSSIYPYERLNINDTVFVNNGSLASPDPLLADKIFSRRQSTQLYNNGRYMFTWLSAANVGDPGIWVDRYYYPDASSKFNTLSEFESHSSSFIDDVDSTSLGLQTRRRVISNEAVFDKRSDIVIEPNIILGYRRVGEDDIKNVISSISPVVSGFDVVYDINNSTCTIGSEKELFRGDSYVKFNKQLINKNQQFTLSFDMYVDSSDEKNFQLMGSQSPKGFSVRTNQELTPFIFNHYENKLYIYNSLYELLSVTEFDKNVRDVIIGDILEDIIVICDEGFAYKVDVSGIKLKLVIVPEIIGYTNLLQEEDNITFLLPDTLESVGNCIVLNKNTFDISYISTSPLKIYEDQGPSVDFALSIIKYKDTLFRVPAEITKKPSRESNLIFFVKNSVNLIRYNLDTNKTDLFLRSSTRIVDFTFDSNDNIIIAHGDTITTLSKERSLLTTFKSPASNSVFIGVDNVRQSVNGVITEKTSGIIYTLDGNILFVSSELDGPDGDVFLTSTEPVITQANISLFSTIPPRFIQTNFNYLRNIISDSSLQFRLILHNYLNTEDIAKVVIDVNRNDIDKSFHNFTYRFDSIQGNITLFIDGKKYKNITVQPGKYKIQETLTDDFYIGTVGFNNGVDLATYLNQPGAFYTTNLKINNFFMFDKAINDDEVIALSLYNKPINTLILSIPAGQRNNIEEIERYFKFGSVSSSKSVDIVIKNLNITDASFRADVERSIREQAESVIPVGVSINNITFENYR